LISNANSKRGANFSRLFKFLLFLPDISLSEFFDLVPHSFLKKSKTFPIDDLRNFSYLKNSLAYFLKYDDLGGVHSKSNYPEYNFNSTIMISSLDIPSYLPARKISQLAFAAFYGSLHSFKFLFLNSATVTSSVCESGIAGGNIQILNICENTYGFSSVAINAAIIYHRNAITNVLFKNSVPNPIPFEVCVRSINIKVLSYLLGNGYDANLIDNYFSIL
jgi:hypothetical protein